METLQKMSSAAILAGQVFMHLLRGRIHWRNTIDQLAVVGTESVLISVITAITIGMVFTIQVSREFISFGASSTIGGVLALALTRELAPVLTAVIIAGRVGSAFAAEVGTMRVTEQIDALEMLRTDPIDYLVTPRFIACVVMLPILTIIGDITGLAGGLFITTSVYKLSTTIYLESAQRFLGSWDLISAMIKAAIFGGLIALIGSNWGLTTTGGARGVGRSTTQAVVAALLTIFIVNFLLSAVMFQGAGQSLQKGF
ncbi:MAG: MlaE family lipid ABC transporter permease subunit [Anaerolineae bacterium]|nr:MlaE family lipid ABC transporter permease subunit [Gloeobacterales cyanobacterium ES-bin-313]